MEGAAKWLATGFEPLGIGEELVGVRFVHLLPINNRSKTMKRVIEIKGAEGGQDAKLFAQDLASAYTSLLDRMS